MPSSIEQAFSIYEIIEHILLQLDNPVEIIRSQHVCRKWRDIVQSSPPLKVACWYQPSNTSDAQKLPVSSRQILKLNPAFNRIGVSASTEFTRDQGEFSLEERIYDKPGSWTTMLATQPPCQQLELLCYGNYSDDEIIYYIIQSTRDYLLMGDIMAVLAECQNRQEYGLDRWAGVHHYTGQILQSEEDSWEEYEWLVFDRMPSDVSISVAVMQLPFGGGPYPAFSLRRVYDSKHFLHEMIVHKMVMNDGREYRWDREHHGGNKPYLVCKTGKYQANLVAVKEHDEGYLSDCSHIFRLLSDIKD